MKLTACSLLWCVLFHCMACTSNEGTNFVGTDSIQVAVLCKSREARPGDNYWMTATVKWSGHVEPNWNDVKGQVSGGTLTNTKMGNTEQLGEGWQKRMVTFNFVSTTTLGTWAELPYSEQGVVKMLSSERCAPGPGSSPN